MRKIVSCLVFFALFFQPVVSFAFSGIATVISCSGSVKIIPFGTDTGNECESGMRLKKGDWISTDKDAHVMVAFDPSEQNIIRVEENTLAVITDTEIEKIELFDGKMIVRLGTDNSGKDFIVKVPSGICGARETGWAIGTDGIVTDISVFENRVYMQGINEDGTLMKEKHWVENGYRRKMKKFEEPNAPIRINKELLDLLRVAAESDEASQRGVIRIGSKVPERAFFSRSSGIKEINGVGVNVDTINSKYSSNMAIVNIGSDN